ncbi:YhgE/Pip domain-containing protein [Brevibacillus fluminis]|uniref:YhgE/Pip domain-containing protein n=1 Tax=Brevibacillus fluminis TaxID=511487 RepID=A0A3M8DQ61_9BACL|nr:YhgE/Pip domain-containing protein [Brevibacillus fluminis]RNB89565.1 YhgE/Pip domain-containing protein [Brevibacillus fluminis]
MNKIGTIYWTDLKKIATNWAAAVVILGLVFLPSLYAWFNIKASWDPYSQTSGIAIAVANNDTGSAIRDKQINLGNEIVNSLKDNKKIGWTFVSEEEAIKGVQEGDYYASIVIPADFSAKIATIMTNNPQKAEIIYTVNEKINAISPKITAKGASGVIEEVNQNFIKTANGTIFRIFNEIGVELQNQLPTIEKLKALVFRLEGMFPEINQAVGRGLTDVERAAQIAAKVQQDLPLVAQLGKDGTDFSNRLGDFLTKSEDALISVSPTIKADLALLQQAAAAAEQLAVVLQENKPDPAVAKALIDQTIKRLTVAASVTDKLKQALTRLEDISDGTRLMPAINKLGQAQSRFQEQVATLTKIKNAIDKGEQPAAELVDHMHKLAAETNAIVGDILGRYDSEIQPSVLNAIEQAKKANQRVGAVLTDAVQKLPEVTRVVQDVAKAFATGKKELQTIQQNLPTYEAQLKALATKMRALDKEANLREIIDLLRHDAQKESEFFAEPVVLKENRLFPIPNYGSAMSPFFTTLSLWVGALLLVSLLTVEVHHPETSYRSYQIYFGRFFTFLTIALLQSLFVTLGDIYLLGTYVCNKLWFVLFGLVLSAVFMLIVYTLVSVFGNIGKALAIVLLVLQLAGSGGTFPIQVTPPFFQAIHPFLPFTYAISMMREAVGGILWHVVTRDLMMLAVYVGIFLLLGLALKKVINRASTGFIQKAKESKLIH